MADLPSRPELWRASVICAKCKQPVERLSTTGLHQSRDLRATGEGWVMAMAECHGDTCDLFMPFAELRKQGAKLVIEVFTDDHVKLYAPLGGPSLYDPETGEAVLKLNDADPDAVTPLPCVSLEGTSSLPPTHGTRKELPR